MFSRCAFACVLGAVAAVPSAAQNINIDFGPPGTGPSATYGGAGLPGVWNSIPGTNTPFQNPQIIYNLVDIHGQPSGVTLYQFGGTELLNANDPSVSGDDAVLLNDAILTHTQNLETCLFINGLDIGSYEVITYAWRPNQPNFLSKVRHDFTPGQPLIGGAWPGSHVEGITYAKHVVEVTTGFIGSHAGNPPGAVLAIGAALNGIQLRRLIPGDLDSDSVVDGADLGLLLLEWGACPRGCSADLDFDGDIDGSDLGILLLNWTG